MKLTQYTRRKARRVIGREPVVCAWTMMHVDKDRIDLLIGMPPGSFATLVRCEMTREEATELRDQIDLALAGLPW